MSLLNTRDRYGMAAIALHWLMLLLFVGVYATGELGEAVEEEYATAAFDFLSLHYAFGLCILALVALRVVVAFAGEWPHVEPVPPAWMRLAAIGMHLSLYLLMIVAPLTGWLAAGAEGEPITVIGTTLPPLTGPSEGLEDLAEEAHEIVATIGYVLIGLHSAAALFHHYLRRDNTMRLMLPGCQ